MGYELCAVAVDHRFLTSRKFKCVLEAYMMGCFENIGKFIRN
jgi:hypothetical protein